MLIPIVIVMVTICFVLWLVMALWSLIERKWASGIAYGIIAILTLILLITNTKEYDKTQEAATIIIVENAQETVVYENAYLDRTVAYRVTDDQGVEHFYSINTDIVRQDKNGK